MRTWRLAARFALRELRGGLEGFRIFLACLAIGVAAIAGIGSVSSSVVSGLRGDARALLGGDVELHLVYREASEAQRAFLGGSGAVSLVRQMRSMARSTDGEQRTLIELKAVDAAYPLYGEVRLDPAIPVGDALARVGGRWGAAVDPAILTRLGLRLGDELRIGDASFVVRAALLREPDTSGTAFVLGPRVLIDADGFAATGLARPGSLVNYDYRVRLAPGTDATAWVAEVRARFPDAGWRVRDFTDAAPSVQRFLDRVSLFLTLVGLTALLVGGVGVGNAVAGYLGRKTATIATLKCLGAPGALVVRTYLLQILALAGLGILIGLIVGACSPLIVTALFADQLPAEARVGLYPGPLALAAAFGILVTLLFSLWPLGRARQVEAAALFRDALTPGRRFPARSYWVAVAVVAVALAALAVATATDRRIAAWFVLGAAVTFAAFRLTALAVIAWARRLPRPRRPGLRLALTNLHRPGAPTGSVILSLGLGLTVLVAISLVQGNLLRQVRERLPEAAPSYFFLDLQPAQTAEFDRLMQEIPGVTGSERMPMLRARITRLDGVPTERAKVAPEAQWGVRGERGLTYAATPPPGSRIVAGSWWPADYHGPPLVSFDAELAKGMGLKVGDTMTFNVLGREITATIGNLRAIDYASLGINFATIFAPGTLEGAPQTFLATARAAPGAEEALQRAVTDRFPNVTAIRIKDVLETIERIFDSIATAIRVTAAITLVAGALVLAGAIAAGHRRRVYDAVVMKVLGATRGDLARSFLVEYGLLGLLTAAIAAALGTLAAYLILTKVMHTDWVFLPGPVAATAALAGLATLVLGFAGTWRALGVKAAPLLRNE